MTFDVLDDIMEQQLRADDLKEI